jgi:hypothetical protein
MKKLILLLALTLSTNVFSQMAPPRQYFKLNLPKSRKTEFRTGPAMLIGGAAFIVAGMLTQQIYEGSSTTQLKPVYAQPRTWAIVSGSLVFTVGIPLTIVGR